MAERDVYFSFVRNLGFCFISWHKLNLKLIILVWVVVQKTRSAILLDSLAFAKFKAVKVHYLPLQSCITLFCVILFQVLALLVTGLCAAS